MRALWSHPRSKAHPGAIATMAAFIFSQPIIATFTIGAANMETRQIGAAGSSCVVDLSIFNATYAVPIPGKSLMIAQALIVDRNHVLTEARVLLENDAPPGVVIDTITDSTFDGGVALDFPDPQTDFLFYTVRQYGVVDVQGRTGGYTGSRLGELYELLGLSDADQSHRNGTVGPYAYAAQGNVVTGGTVQTLEETFVSSSGCDLADRLVGAVRAVSDGGEGDDRCIIPGYTQGVAAPIPGTGAFLHVDNPDGTPLVHIDVVGDGTFNPVSKLAEEYDAWRVDNPCPGEGDGGADGCPTTSPTFSSTNGRGPIVYVQNFEETLSSTEFQEDRTSSQKDRPTALSPESFGIKPIRTFVFARRRTGFDINVNNAAVTGGTTIQIKARIGLRDRRVGRIKFQAIVVFDNGEQVKAKSRKLSWDANLKGQIYSKAMSVPAGATQIVGVKLKWVNFKRGAERQEGFLGFLEVREESETTDTNATTPQPTTPEANQITPSPTPAHAPTPTQSNATTPQPTTPEANQTTPSPTPAPTPTPTQTNGTTPQPTTPEANQTTPSPTPAPTPTQTNATTPQPTTPEANQTFHLRRKHITG